MANRQTDLEKSTTKQKHEARVKELLIRSEIIKFQVQSD